MQNNILFIILILAITSCSINEKSPYEGCCEQSAINVNIGKGRLVIPNYVSPDGDFYVDFFDVFIDSNMKEIKDIRFYTNTGRELKFQVTVIIESNKSKIYRWGISETNNYLNPTLGSISYTMTAFSIDSVSRSVSGSFCSIKCKDAKSNIKQINNCQSVIQYNGNEFDNSELTDICF